jgi:hypothetical protein
MCQTPIIQNNEEHSWICDCYKGQEFIMPHDYFCCFTCLKINPRFLDTSALWLNKATKITTKKVF